MKNLKEQTDRLLSLFGFRESRAEYDEENKRVSIYISDDSILEKQIPVLVNSFDKVLKLIAKKYDEGPISVDVNNHHKEREKMIIELAKAAAKKAATTKTDVPLPPMNSFERRLVHNEIAVRPDLKTESIGDGEGRRVVVKYIG